MAPSPRTISSRPPIQRMQWLDGQLRRRRFPTAVQAMAQFEISRRTFYRDVQYMRLMLGAPIGYDRRRRGYYYTDDSFNLAAVQLTQGELLALLIAEHVLEQYEGTPFGARLSTAIDKIARSLPERVTVDLSGSVAPVVFDLGPLRPPDKQTFERVVNAVRHHTALRIRYFTQSRGRETERVVQPYHLHNHKGDWYLIAFCRKRKAVRDFLLSRIRHAAPTGEHFAVPDGFDIDAYTHHSFDIEKGGQPVRIRIWFDAYQAPWIRERRWHPTQQIAEHDDGSLTVSFKTTGLNEVTRWVLSYGQHAVVLSPVRLRRQVKQALAKAIGRYAE